MEELHFFRVPCALMQAAGDGHARSITLNEVKGLSERFFAALRMTKPNEGFVMCTNVMLCDLDCLITNDFLL